MLELALFIGAHLAPPPVLPLNPPITPDAQVKMHAARFVSGGGLGEYIWVDLALPEVLREPAPTPSIRLIVGSRSAVAVRITEAGKRAVPVAC